jgi:hypothetical protein
MGLMSRADAFRMCVRACALLLPLYDTRVLMQSYFNSKTARKWHFLPFFFFDKLFRN